MSNQTDPKIIDASPTKDFFIYMLVKDIPLIRAIIDLVDNGVDGARRLRSDNNYHELWIRLELSENHFRIADNCGGIAVNIARHYAFRFGRPEGMEPTRGSVGQFGVGMKRSFFKIGKKFKVESKTETERFIVEEDVEEWKKRTEWEFEFKELEENLEANNSDQFGTTIEVTSLHDSVKDNFKLEHFRINLIRELTAAHQLNMERGLAISLNGIPLTFQPLSLLHSDQLKPAYKELIFDEKSNSPVHVQIYCGISESSPLHAGCYVFCNGRMLLEADQTLTTGWGEGNEGTIPKYHNQYAMVRAFVFFDSDDASKLPWNTTKTGVDSDSSVFKAVRLELITLMRPLINFLNKLKQERVDKERKEADETPLEKAINAAGASILSNFNKENSFQAPLPKPVYHAPRTARVQYHKPINEVDKVKQVLKVRTNWEVGEKTFEYFLKMECDD